jgi:hypothetical protein
MERREFLKKTALKRSNGRRKSNTALTPTASRTAPRMRRCRMPLGNPRRAADRGGTLLGAHQPGEEGRTALRSDRQYHRWDDLLPSKYEQWTRANGRTPYVSWNTYLRSGQPVSWAQIATGKHDTWIRTQAQSIRSWGRNMYFTFNHEPENDASHCGSSGATGRRSPASSASSTIRASPT